MEAIASRLEAIASSLLIGLDLMHQLRSDLLRKFARSLRSIAVVARCWQPVLALLDEGRREHIQADAILGPYDPSWGQFGSVFLPLRMGCPASAGSCW